MGHFLQWAGAIDPRAFAKAEDDEPEPEEVEVPDAEETEVEHEEPLEPGEFIDPEATSPVSGAVA